MTRPAKDTDQREGERALNRCVDQLPDDYSGMGRGLLTAVTLGSGMSGYESMDYGNSTSYGPGVSPELERCMARATDETSANACLARYMD